jgi:glycosyltransferase involved in cell wall biosynthesis
MVLRNNTAVSSESFEILSIMGASKTPVSIEVEIQAKKKSNMLLLPTMLASVVIPCYKPGVHFEKVLDDLNNQTSNNFEVIFADDGNDEPLEPRISARLKRPYQVIRFQTNRGIGAGLNACINHAQTPYVIRMDADDRMPQNRIERQLHFMNAHPEVDIAGGSQVTFGAGLRVWSKPCAKDEVTATLLWVPSLNHPTIIGRTDVLKQNPYPNGHSEDYALWISLASKGVHMMNVPDVIHYYRIEGQNVSITGKKERALRYSKLFKHALQSLLPDSNLEILFEGIDQGCHHRLAGIEIPSELAHPTNHEVSEYAEILTEALKKQTAPWAAIARQEVSRRLHEGSGNRRLRKLQPLWNLWKLSLSDWLFLLTPNR